MARFFTNILILATLSLAGCATQSLPADWDPITTVSERGGIAKETVVTTVSPYLYVSSLEWFNERYPEGSVDHEALRRHERQHALEQEEYIGDATGLRRTARMVSWIRKYLTDKDFRWEVEKRGYRETILYKLSQGQPVYAEYYARILSGSTYNNMVSYEEALQWVRDVIRYRR